MKCPVHLQTKFGVDFYKSVLIKFDVAKSSNNIDIFYESVQNELTATNDELETFLEDEDLSKQFKMDDVDVTGWKYFKEMSDKSSILSYFARSL